MPVPATRSFSNSRSEAERKQNQFKSVDAKIAKEKRKFAKEYLIEYARGKRDPR